MAKDIHNARGEAITAKEKRIDALFNQYEETIPSPAKDKSQGKSSRQSEAKAPEPSPSSSRGEWQRVSFVCVPEDVWKLRAIALIDRKSMKSVLHDALDGYIRAWQTSHKGIDIDIFK